MLSAEAAKTMRNQVLHDDEVVKNKTAISEILKTLPPSQP